MYENQVSQDRDAKSKLDGDTLHLDVSRALSSARAYAFNLQHPDGHWCGEFATCAYTAAEHIFFCQANGIDFSAHAALFRKWLFSLQNPDGSWSYAPDHPGDVSVSAEAYLALKILGAAPEGKELRLARDFIRGAGGIANVRVLTRIFFAQFGLLPWKAVPQLPAELMLLPQQCPINIYTFPYFSRVTIVPLLLLRHHEPIYALPNRRSASNDYLDELWIDPRDKAIPYGRPFFELLTSDATGLAFKKIDYLLHAMRGLRYSPTRYLAKKAIFRWLLDRQSQDGSWFGFITPFQLTIQVLLLEGFKLEDPPIRRALTTMETWAWEDEDGKRIQLSTSPVWDTALMMKAICISGPHRNAERVRRAADWCKAQQLLGPRSDLAIYCPDLPAGGFAFQYDNPWYPDVDDSAAIILALLDQDPGALEKFAFIRGAEWILGMQNADGRFSAFDRNCDKSWLHKSPFNDMDNLCDPSTADVTGRVLELCGLIIRGAATAAGRPPPHLVARARLAAPRAISFLAAQQEADGSWWGRWGVNFAFGTCHALGGLALFAEAGRDGPVAAIVARGAAWLAHAQHADGGWGESVATYDVPPAPPGTGPSLPSPTAWALMGLLAAGTLPSDPVVRRGVQWLVREQRDSDGAGGVAWVEPHHTGMGFPRKMSIGYTLYRVYFPMIALGQYIARCGGQRKHGGSGELERLSQAFSAGHRWCTLLLFSTRADMYLLQAFKRKRARSLRSRGD